MKQTLLLLFLLLGAAGSVSVSAQSTWGSPSDDQYNSEARMKLNLDYSMPQEIRPHSHLYRRRLSR